MLLMMKDRLDLGDRRGLQIHSEGNLLYLDILNTGSIGWAEMNFC